ncbi:MAG: TonB-dependent receptor [Robiginitomaculum sp.]|nr:MAG: TonB-dependent receptor [Robiginitomaculum sp.]
MAIGMSLAAFGTASAQEAADDEIIVTGFRQSLARALDVKRRDTGIVDAILAEDIADFPDLNLAESLQRIPGVTIDRAAGEGRRLTVRGLGGTFTRVRINGMESISTGGGSDASGGSNRSRAFDFNAFSADLFNGLTVRKSQSASVEEGSLGANVELSTAHPFDYDAGFSGAASAQAQYNDLSEDIAPRLSGLASYSNEDQTFGVLLSASYSDRDIREEGFSSVRFDDLGTFRSVNGDACVGANPLPASCETVRNSYYARIPRYGRLDYQQKRLGLSGSVQMRPSDSTTVTLDGLYSKFDGVRDENFLEVFIRSNTDNLDVTDSTINSDGVLSRLVANVQPDASTGIIPVRSEHRRDFLTSKFTQFTANVEHEFTSNLTGNILAGTSESKFDVPIQATIFFDAAVPVTGYSYDFTDNPNAPSIGFGNFDVTAPGSFLFTQYRNRPQDVNNKFSTLQANLKWVGSDDLTISGGVSWKKFEFDTSEIRTGGDVEDLPGFNAPIPVTAAISEVLTGFGDGLDATGIDTSWISANWQAAVDMIDLLNIPGTIRAQSTRGVDEEDVGAYLQADFSLNIGSLPVHGDIGARYVETTTVATGILSGNTVSIERTYDDFLPAVNLVFDVSENLLVRTGLAKVMARPALGNLTPGGSIDTFNGPPFNISIGNPGLDPFRATNFDLSVEWYFAEEALLAFAWFYKDIESFSTAAATIETTFSASGFPTSVAGVTSPLGELLALGQDPLVEINQRINGDDASLSGFEIVYQQPFTFLPAPFDQFGFTGNFTHVSSDDIIGFSPNSFNTTLYYENDKFSARFSGAYRDAYVTRNARTSDGREERGVASSFNLDFAASYQYTDALTFTFEAVNLTDEHEHQTFDQLLLPTLYHHTGRNFLVGAKYKF